MAAKGRRNLRVADLIREEIGNMLIRELKDPRLGFITITDVVMPPDLKSAQVFYSVLGSEGERKNCAEGLANCAGYLRKEIGQRLRLRYAPEIHFHYDDSIEYGQRIEDLLKKAKAGTDENGK
jgi:ribosome-binding factor A